MTELLALVGPTASGKSRIASALAPDLGSEIVCADSMTVYRGMDIGTAKPDAAAREAVPHHLLDVADPSERYTVAAFQSVAREALEGIRLRGRRPFIVGGSGLYFRAIVDGLSFPPGDPEVRARLEREDAGVLEERLREQDPAAAEFVDLANRRRVVRALEVIEVTGRPFSSFRDEWERRRPVVVAGLRVSPEEIARRARTRLHTMLADGFLDEVRGLLDRGYRDALTASQAVAYREATAHLDGEITREEFLEQAVRSTRRLARRQMSWFRRDPRIHWVEAQDLDRATLEVGAYYERRLDEEKHACGS